MTEFRVGTSGYNYFWNEGKPSQFKWYLSQKFNSVEINATFYSFPYKSWIKSWSSAPDNFDFSIKVNRIITHYSKLSEKAIAIFEKFKNSFKEIEEKIAFWLFQMPPSFEFNETNLKRIRQFFSAVNIPAVIEFRDPSWWNETTLKILKELNVVFCSVDAPELPNDIVETNGIIYLRLHGREEWYSYEYKREELDEIIEKINQISPLKCYIYLNNDHGMLPNGLYLLKKLDLIKT
ncbi:MAG: DUF72 domain-containing protein [Thermoproteota archaeon]|jgi:uncharacterized protein YecE (DUF72 family)|nr:DUF72 domain-containing protein [Thermoproteota archaeon]